MPQRRYELNRFYNVFRGSINWRRLAQKSTTLKDYASLSVLIYANFTGHSPFCLDPERMPTYGRSDSSSCAGFWLVCPDNTAGSLVNAPICSGGSGTATDTAATTSVPDCAAEEQSDQAYCTTLNYVIRFYPRFMTYYQQNHSPANRLSGPDHMGPEFGIVVAPNDDTLYTTFRLDLAGGPQILTIPATTATYSLLTLDVWGQIISTNIPQLTPGTYALVSAGSTSALPTGAITVSIPYPMTWWIVRVDKYAANGEDQIATATTFRKALRLTSLATYNADPSRGATQLLPLILYTSQMKTITDSTVADSSDTFLQQLQQALHDPTTAPLTSADTQLSTAFDTLFATAQQNPDLMNRIVGATHTAHDQIVQHWETHVNATHWVYFDNIGRWGTTDQDYLDRAALSEYIQYGNSSTTAKYYDAFTDSNGNALDGHHAYQLTFTSAQIPRAKRFWSLTAYTPPGITLVSNAANKYAVASYTPGLHRQVDGSITIYIQSTPPTDTPDTNWLPVPTGPFSLLLRVYGPDGNTATDYTPPGIVLQP